MRLPLLVMLTLITLATASASSRLVFRGTILRIDSGGANSLKPFVVTTSVDKILDGQFSGKRFQFAVHSPSQSGLQIGHRYTVRADIAANGYIVDELQWRRR
jgi:hypothetical protein